MSKPKPADKAAAPRVDSLAHKVIKFLQANPDETLDADIISAKFDVPRAGVHTKLGRYVELGELARTEDLESGKLIYSLGPFAHKPATTAAGAGFPWAPKQPTKRKQRTTFWIDVGTLKIDKGISMPAAKCRAVNWPTLLDKMEIGDSFLLQLEGKYAIMKYLSFYKQATGKTLSTRIVDDGVRVWRTA